MTLSLTSFVKAIEPEAPHKETNRNADLRKLTGKPEIPVVTEPNIRTENSIYESRGRQMRKQSSQIKIIEDETESHRSRSDRNSMNSSMISSNSTCSIEETSYDSSNRKKSACFSSDSTARGRPIARRKSSKDIIRGAFSSVLTVRTQINNPSYNATPLTPLPHPYTRAT